MSHGNARLTPAGRLLLVRRVAAGEPQAEVACQMRLSRGTVTKWWGRWVELGDAGLADCSSRPDRSPRRTDAAAEERICRRRRATKRGPAYLSARTGVLASTVWRVLRRHGLDRLDRLDCPTAAGAPRKRRPVARPEQSVLSPHSRFAPLVPSLCRTAGHVRCPPLSHVEPQLMVGVRSRAERLGQTRESDAAVMTARGGADCG